MYESPPRQADFTSPSGISPSPHIPIYLTTNPPTVSTNTTHNDARTHLRRSPAKIPNPPPPPSPHNPPPLLLHSSPPPNNPHPTPRIPPPSLPAPLHDPSPHSPRLAHLSFPPAARNHRHNPPLRPRRRFPLLRLAAAVDSRRGAGESRGGEVRALFEAERVDCG